jgi:hypothetical protein
MDFKQELLKEHSKVQALRIADYIGKSSERYGQLMHFFFSNEPLVSQRAAWVMRLTARRHPTLFVPYVEKCVGFLSEPHLHDAVVRNILRLFSEIPLPEKVQGNMVDICLSYVQDPRQPGAIKAFSITVLKNICQHYPELAPEIVSLLKERLPYESPAFKVRARHFLNAFPS